MKQKNGKAKKGKSVTTDQLALMVGKGFKEMDERFDQVDAHFGRVENRLSAVEQKIDLLRADIQELRFDHKKMLTRIENLELKAFGSVQE